MKRKSMTFSWDIVERYFYLVHIIKRYGGIMKASITKRYISENLPPQKLLTIQCIDMSLHFDVTRYEDGFICKFIEGLFNELDTICVQDDLLSFKRVRGPRQLKGVRKNA